jgi:hypothetical protein
LPINQTLLGRTVNKKILGRDFKKVSPAGFGYHPRKGICDQAILSRPRYPRAINPLFFLPVLYLDNGC